MANLSLVRFSIPQKPIQHRTKYRRYNQVVFCQGPKPFLKYEVKSLSRARLFATPWRVACTKLLHPWDFLGKSTGVGCHSLLQGIFLTQGLNPGLPHCRQMLYYLSHQGKSKKSANRASLVVQTVKRLSSSAGDLGLIPGSGRFPGEGNGNPLQYSCLENPMDGGAWCRLLSMGSQRVGHD